MVHLPLKFKCISTRWDSIWFCMHDCYTKHSSGCFCWLTGVYLRPVGSWGTRAVWTVPGRGGGTTTSDEFPPAGKLTPGGSCYLCPNWPKYTFNLLVFVSPCHLLWMAEGCIPPQEGLSFAVTYQIDFYSPPQTDRLPQTVGCGFLLCCRPFILLRSLFIPVLTLAGPRKGTRSALRIYQHCHYVLRLALLVVRHEEPKISSHLGGIDSWYIREWVDAIFFTHSFIVQQHLDNGHPMTFTAAQNRARN